MGFDFGIAQIVGKRCVRAGILGIEGTLGARSTRQEVHPQALGRLLAAFADPAVGVVSGELVFAPYPLATTAARGVNAY